MILFTTDSESTYKTLICEYIFINILYTWTQVNPKSTLLKHGELQP